MTLAGNAAAAVSGRATGALFFAGFGSIWMCNGLAAMHRLNSISLAAILAIAAALAISACRLMAAAAANSPHSKADSPEELAMKRDFWRVNVIQWAAILAAILLLNLIHKAEFLAPVITFVVGMHLYPLAKLFRYPAHNVTATLLVVWAIVDTAMLPGSMLPSFGAIGTAAILLGSAAYTVVATTRVARHLTGVSLLKPQSV